MVIIFWIESLTTLYGQVNEKKIFENIKIIKIIARQNYKEADKVSLPFYEYSKEDFKLWGFFSSKRE